MLRLSLAAPLVAAFLLGGCASTVTTQVTSFHQLADSLQGRRFVIVPSGEQSTSLEFNAYADLVREALAAKGLVDAGGRSGGTAADLGVSLSYDVSGRPSGYRNGTGVFGGFGAGSGGFSMSGIGIGIGFPIGGGGGGDSSVYQRSLTVQIDRLGGAAQPGLAPSAPAAGAPGTSGSGLGAPGAGTAGAGGSRIFEARAISEGESASLAPVMRAMVQAIFEDFPGQSGRTRVVKVPLEADR
jgi:hypothetical protein